VLRGAVLEVRKRGLYSELAAFAAAVAVGVRDSVLCDLLLIDPDGGGLFG
jgi:hypothetical protein